MTSTKPLILLILLFFLPFNFLSVYTFTYISSSAEDGFITVMNRFTRNSATNIIETPVEEIVTLLRSLSSNIDRATIEKYISKDRNELNSIIPALINSTFYFKNARISDANGNDKIYPHVPSNHYKPVMITHENQATIKNEVVFSESFENSSSKKKQSTVNMNLFDSSAELIGNISFVLDLKAMSRAFKDIIAPYNARALVVDSSGTIIMYSNANYIQHKTVPKTWLSSATEVSGHFYDDLQKKHIFYRSYHNPNWTLFSVVNNNEFKKITAKALKDFYILLVFCGFFYIILIYLLSMYFNRFISHLYMSANGIDIKKTEDMSTVCSQIKEKHTKLAAALSDADTDGLTSVKNRKKFDSDLSELINTGKNISLAIIDIDDFKKINDGYGHDMGDIVLRYVSRSGLGIIEATGCAHLYRYGGEELAVIFENYDIADAHQLIDEWREIVSNKKWREHEALKVTFSGGLSIRYEDDTAQSILKRADAQLYHAKRTGKNQIIFKD